jgi:hypothetical protein
MRLVYFVCALVCSSALSFGVDTKTWDQSSMEDFDQGTLQHLSLSSDGRLAVAPRLSEVFDASVAVLWSVARDSKGALYVGGGSLGGSRAKLFSIAQGQGKLLAELDGIAVQAIAIDRQDRVYAATSPDGKVYRVDSSGKADVFYDPKTKYIWALAFAKNGDLYVATGDRGEIHRVTPAGVGSVFFRTEEAHARSLTVDAADNVIVGTEPSGLILRVAPAGSTGQGQGFVLYQAPKREITAVAVGPDGAIYAAGAGNRTATPAQPPTAVGAPPQPAAPVPAPPGTVQIVPPSPTPVATPILTSLAVTGGSEIYRIQNDGYPRRIWSHAQDLVYALAFDAQGRVLAGTGNRGNLYRIDNDYSYTRLLNVEPTQITGLLRAPDGRIYAVTGNIGKVIAIGPGREPSGIFESDVLDTGGFSYWGHVGKQPETLSGSADATVIETRSGNVGRAQRNWSSWTPLSQGRVASPSARFLQYRATLSGNAELSEVGIAYQMKNVAPAVALVEITPPNYRFPAPAAPAATMASPTLALPPIQRRPAAAVGNPADSGVTPALTRAKGQIGARWLAEDENADALEFKVEIRGVNETAWKLVRDKVRERYLSWDSTAYPDGKYILRVTASDAPSNPPDQALTGLRESDPFLIDNTPPEITWTGVTEFHAKDALSTLGRAEYSINGGDWIVVEPTTRLTDSREHDYRVTLASRPPGEVTVAVRVEDAYGNQAVAKTVLK